MGYWITLLHQDRIYHHRLDGYKSMSFGSNKKDTVFVADIDKSAITVIRNQYGISVKVKGIKGTLPSDIVNHITPLFEQTRTALFITEAKGVSEQIIKLPYQCTLLVGRSPQNAVQIKRPYISGQHCVIRNESGIVHVEDSNSTNGVYVNGKRISRYQMQSGDVISLMDVQIMLKDGVLSFENAGQDLSVQMVQEKAFQHEARAVSQGSSRRYRRSPRTQEQLPAEDIFLASAPARGQKYVKSRGMFSSLIGSGAMAVSTLAMGAVSPALMAARAASLAMPISNVASQAGGGKKRKKKLEEYELLRQEKYFQYISEQKARIEVVAQQQRTILTRENPAPPECLNIVRELRRNLWERMPSDRDFLHVRLGMGYEDLCIRVHTRTADGTVQMEDDEVKEMSEQLIEETRIVDNLPRRLSLKEYTTVGIIGDRRRVIGQVKNMIISLTAAHCFEEVRIVGLFDEKEYAAWEALRWLPHIWDDNKQFRYLAFGQEQIHQICEMFEDELRKRQEKLSAHNYGQKPVPVPYYIFLLGAKGYMEQEELMGRLFMNTPEMGVTSLFLFDDLYSLPHDCEYIIDMDGNPNAYPRDQVNHKIYFTPDYPVPDQQFDAYARGMSAIELDGFAVKKEIPNGITFLQGYGVETVEQLDVLNRWSNSHPEESLAAPLGMMSGGKVFSLDIFDHMTYPSAHGPHGLIAGTTGSGKSELIQTWILSVAVNYHPHDVVFVLIDYKGGGMANLLEPLPHVVGKVTNIGSNISRALISLRSEVKRRELIFDRAGVNNIEKYQKLYRNGQTSEPLPYLVIVSDEFAELKKEEPDFMRSLIEVARVGRTLGIRMVLATQKPAGIVDDQINSNTTFRICLKVQTTADSQDMLKRPDAAMITQAGRAYVKVGENDLFDTFQSYWSGAPYLGHSSAKEKVGNQVRVVSNTGERIKTVIEEHTRFKSDTDELTAIIRYIHRISEEAGIQGLPGPWTDELPEMVSLQEILQREEASERQWLKAPVGIFDAPEQQVQGIQYLDFEEYGHYGIYGAPSTGKSSLLHTLVMSLVTQYTPKEINLYILDCGGWGMSIFADFPQVGGVALDTEEEKYEKFEGMMLDELEHRKTLFLRSSVHSLNAYRESVSDDLPVIMIIIDNFPALFGAYPKLEQLFITLSSQGATYGIYLVYTANSMMAGIKHKVLQNIKGAVAFELTEKGEYSQTVGRLEGKTLSAVRGRAFHKGVPPMEFQAAMAAPGASDVERASWIKEFAAKVNENWQGERAKGIPVMLDQVSWASMLESYTVRNQFPLGVRDTDIQPALVDLSEDCGFLAIGKDQKRPGELLCSLGAMITEKHPGDLLYVIDSAEAPLKPLEQAAQIYTPCNDEQKMHQIIDTLVARLNDRLKDQKEAKRKEDWQGDTEFAAGYPQICLFVSGPDAMIKAMLQEDYEALKRIIRMVKGFGMIIFVGGTVQELANLNQADPFIKGIVAMQNAAVVGGAPAGCGFLKSGMSYTDKAVEVADDVGYLFDHGIAEKVKWMGLPGE